MEGFYSTGQSSQQAVVPMEEGEITELQIPFEVYNCCTNVKRECIG
jgi:hypothetical protein